MKTDTPSSAPTGRIAHTVEAIAAWFNSTLRGSDDLTQADPRDIEAMARDIGLSAPELARAVAGSNGSTAELTRLLEALSLDRQSISAHEPGTMRDLSRLCASCGDKRRCNHDLKAGVITETYRDYCPNAYTVDALVAETERSA